MGKGLILWLLGVPFPLIVVLWVFGVLRCYAGWEPAGLARA